ncbi:MAG: diguanylate cyclase [Solirubrobacteraceae bacterium]
MPPTRRVSQTADRDQASADFAAGLADLGLSYKTSWYSSAVLYGVGGSLCAGLYTLDHSLMPAAISYLGWIALGISAFSLWGARHLADRPDHFQEWMLHARLSAGFAINVVAAPILGTEINVFTLFPLVLIPSACFLLPPRRALIYVFAATTVILLAVGLTHGTAQLAHALISALVVLLIAGAILVTKLRTRALAVRNRELALTDPLTAVANVRSLRERISAEHGCMSGKGSPFALFAIDLDEFKQVNERFDHSMGDRLLCAVADALEGELSPGDLLARRGGDEFSVLAPSAGGRDLDDLAERLERAIAAARLQICPAVTPSGSVAYIRTRPGEEVGALMERADTALHDSKLVSRARRRGEAQRDFAPTAAAPPADQTPGVDSTLGAVAAGERPRAARNGVARAVVDAAMRGQPDWRFAALLIGLIAAGLAVVAGAGLVRPLGPSEGLVLAAALVVLSLGCLYGAGAGLSQKWLHVPWTLACCLIALAIGLAQPAGTALLDGLVAIAVYGFLIFKARTAMVYMLAALLLYGIFAVAGHYQGGLTRTLITSGIVAVVSGVVAKLRLATNRFTRINRELSEVDELTGVANVRGLRGRVTTAIERAETLKLHPSLISVDLDDFKSVNDLHSHTLGDRVLVVVARAISESVRIDELVGRRGGDEFVVVIDGAGKADTDAIAARIKEAIVRARMRLCPDVTPAASVAIVEWSPGQSAEDLLHRADVALHDAKAESHARRGLAATA